MGVIGWALIIVGVCVVIGIIIAQDDTETDMWGEPIDKEWEKKKQEWAERKKIEGDDFYKNNIEARRKRGEWFIWEKGYWKKNKN